LKTIYIGREEVVAYAKDLAARIEGLGTDAPTVWCPIGHSGDHLLREILPFLPDTVLDNVQTVPVTYNKTAGQASLEDPQDAVVLADKPVLLLDSSVHSGGSMLECARLLGGYGAAKVLTYSLVVKRGSERVNDFATPGFMNLLCRVEDCGRGVSPVVAG